MFPEVPAKIADDRWLEDNGEELRLDYDLDENSIVLDIGSHVGDWAHDIISRYNCTVHLFEPYREFADEASKRFKDNPKIHVHNFAILDYDGFADLALHGTGSTLFSSSSNNCRIRVRNISDVFAELQLKHIHLAKINIEGAEFDLLDHMISTGLLTAFDNLQIQFHDVFKDAVDRRRRIQNALAHTHAPTYNYAFVWENWVRTTPKVREYEIINRHAAQQITVDGWNTNTAATKQHTAFRLLLDDLKTGKPRKDIDVLDMALKYLPSNIDTLLEVGCGSGYISEVIHHSRPDISHYIGLDRAAAMTDLGQKTYPEHEFLTGNANALPFTDKSIDVVLNGVSLMHTIDYPQAIAECARVAKRYCVFSTVPIHTEGGSVYLRKFAYDNPVFEINFHEQEIVNLFELAGLKIVNKWESLAYDLSDVIGEPTTTKTYVCEVLEFGKSNPLPHLRHRGPFVNIGCGRHYAAGWKNFDIQPYSNEVLKHDILERLPLGDESCTLVYHSHVLEHLPRWQAPHFLRECFRVLRPGGVLRVVIPDLEVICRLYLENLSKAIEGDVAATERREWMMIELIDQMVREESGGEMLRYWQQYPIPEKDFMLSRVGHEARPMVESVQSQIDTEQAGRSTSPLFGNRDKPDTESMAQFRQSGEVHQWMYDRLSLTLLLEECGFVAPRICVADQSSIPGFEHYGLERLANGDIRKPDSLFVEAYRPAP